MLFNLCWNCGNFLAARQAQPKVWTWLGVRNCTKYLRDLHLVVVSLWKTTLIWNERLIRFFHFPVFGNLGYLGYPNNITSVSLVDALLTRWHPTYISGLKPLLLFPLIFRNLTTKQTNKQTNKQNFAQPCLRGKKMCGNFSPSFHNFSILRKIEQKHH